MVNEDAGVERLVVLDSFAAEYVGPCVCRGSNIARAKGDVVGLDEFLHSSRNSFIIVGDRDVR
jgi:hypothetical protein